MRPFNLLAIFPLAALAALNGPCTGPPDGKATGDYLTEGICVVDCVDSSGTKGYQISGGCPFDDNDIKCCLIGLDQSTDVNPCGGGSFCGWNNDAHRSFCTGSPFYGSFHAGYCPGPSDYECCLIG